MTLDGDATRLMTTPVAVDPYILVSESSLDRSIANRVSLVTPASLGLVNVVLLALLIACIVVIGRAAFVSRAGEAGGRAVGSHQPRVYPPRAGQRGAVRRSHACLVVACRPWTKNPGAVREPPALVPGELD